MKLGKRDLVVGNYFNFPIIGNQRWENGVLESCNSLNDIKPIPLTPEILEKAGFELQSHGWRKSLGELECSVFFGNEMVTIEVKTEVYSDELDFNHIRYVHQLQNFWYANTGKELEISL